MFAKPWFLVVLIVGIFLALRFGETVLANFGKDWLGFAPGPAPQSAQAPATTG